MDDELKRLRASLDYVKAQAQELSFQVTRLEKRLSDYEAEFEPDKQESPDSPTDLSQPIVESVLATESEPTRKLPPPIPQLIEQAVADPKAVAQEKVGQVFQKLADKLDDSVVPAGGQTTEGQAQEKPKRVLDAAGIETFLGENFLNKIGVVVLVIGLALALGYGYTHFLGPFSKVAMGLALSFAIIGGGVYFERREKWRLYARGLLGGGWALLYFTVFAAHHFENTRIIESPVAGIIILFAVAIGIIAHSLKYRSQTVTGLAYFIAFFTLTLSPLRGFSLVSTAALAASLVAVQWRLRWQFLGILGVASVYLGFAFWLHPIMRLTGVEIGGFQTLAWPAGILIVYWLLFTVSHLLMKDNDQAALLVMVSNAGAFYRHFRELLKITGNEEFEWFLTACLGIAYLCILLYAELLNREKLRQISAAIAALFIAVAIPQKLSGPGISIGWLIVGQIAMISAIVRKQAFYAVPAAAFFIAAVIHLLGYELVNKATMDIGAITLFQHMPSIALGLCVCYLNGYLLCRIKFEKYREIIAPISTLLFIMGTMVTLTLAKADLQAHIFPAAWAIVAAALMAAGVAMGLLNLRIQAYLISIFVPIAYFDHRAMWAGLVSAAAILAADRIHHENRGRLPIFAAKIGKRPLFSWQIGDWLMAGVLTILLMGAVEDVVSLWNPMKIGASWAGLGLLLFIAGLALIELRYRVAGYATMMFSLTALKSGPHIWTKLLLGATILATYLLVQKASMKDRLMPWEQRFRWVVAAVAGVIYCVIFYKYAEHEYLTIAWAGVSFGLMGLGMVFKDRPVRFCALGLLGVCLLKVFFIDLRGLAPFARILSFVGLGAVMLASSYIYTRYRDKISKYI